MDVDGLQCSDYKKHLFSVLDEKIMYAIVAYSMTS